MGETTIFSKDDAARPGYLLRTYRLARAIGSDTVTFTANADFLEYAKHVEEMERLIPTLEEWRIERDRAEKRLTELAECARQAQREAIRWLAAAGVAIALAGAMMLYA